MHELSLALSILDLVAEEAERQPGRIVAVHVKLGPLAGVVPQALRSAFDLAREGTPQAATELVLEETPLVAYCSTCAAERRVASMQDLCCPACGAPTPDLASGRELEVVALEVQV